MAGHVYLLTNPSMPRLIKIGCTERPLPERIAELSASTGVPTPFVLEYSMLVADQDAAEKELHIALHPYRINSDREFFRIEADKARRILQDTLIAMTLAELLKWKDDSLTKLVDMIFQKRPGVRNNF